MKNLDFDAYKKADLINNNQIFIPADVKLPFFLNRSTAGPDANSHSIGISFNKTNVKLNISENKSEMFSLNKTKNGYNLLKYGKNYIDNVNIIPIYFHAPNQIFLNLDDRCIYNCGFCNLSKKGLLKNYDDKKFTEFIVKSAHRKNINSIALTSGVFPDNNHIINKMSKIVKEIKKIIPKCSIGIESCIFNRKEVELLKVSGVDEIKINLQIPDRMMFSKICPDFNYDLIIDNLINAVEIFGKEKVTSNIIFGLGETDETVVKSIEELSKIGVVPTLRKIRINKKNKEKLIKILNYDIPKTSNERIINLAYGHKRILEKYKLDTRTFQTMCHKCGCCDIVPFWDI